MKITLDGRKITNFTSLVQALALSLRSTEGDKVYFGWDSHSLADCLQGGYMGQPPYEIKVECAEMMVKSFDHSGMAHYCEDMLCVIDSGGRGLVQEDSRAWFTAARQKALEQKGDTLLDFLFEAICTAPASITLYAQDGQLLAKAVGSMECVQ